MSAEDTVGTTLQLHIKSLAGCLATVDINELASVFELKKAIYSQLPNFAPQCQRLMHSVEDDFESLENGRTLASYHISNDATINILIVPATPFSSVRALVSVFHSCIFCVSC
jgi:hypothetical protein